VITSQKLHKDEIAEYKNRYVDVVNELSKVRESNVVLLREMSCLREENKKLSQDNFALKRIQFELTADLQDYKKLELSSHQLKVKSAAADQQMLQALAIRNAAEQVMRDTKLVKDARAEHLIIIETLKREKSLLHVNYDEKCRVLDVMKSNLDQVANQLEEAKVTIDIEKEKINQLSASHDKELNDLNITCFDLHKVIIRLHEKILDLMVQLGDDSYNCVRQKMTEAMKTMNTKSSVCQRRYHSLNTLCELKKIEKVSLEVPTFRPPASLPIDVPQTSRCPLVGSPMYNATLQFARNMVGEWWFTTYSAE
jgi:chromosome segregation ATPase